MRLTIKQAMFIPVYEQLLPGIYCRQEKKDYQKIQTTDLTYLPLNFGLASPLVSCDSRVGVVNEQQAEGSYQKYHETYHTFTDQQQMSAADSGKAAIHITTEQY